MSSASTDWLLRTRLNLRQLALLVSLDERRSILHAASATHLTQPAASKLLSALESSFGVKLFVRHSRGVEPTPCGEIIVRHARGVLAELRQAQEEIAAIGEGVRGEVAIGTEVTSATWLVSRAVAALKRDYPDIRVGIEVNFSESLTAGLLDREFDIVIARLHHAGRLGGVEFEELKEAPHGLVVRRGHPLMGKRALSLKDLVTQTWIVPPVGNISRDRFSELFLRTRTPFPRSVVETTDLSVIVELLRSSDMVAPLAMELAQPFCESKVLGVLPLDLKVRLGAAGIVTRGEQQLSPASRVALRVLRETAHEVLGAAHEEKRPARVRRG